MADDATIALKQDAVKETTTTGAKQASSREAELEARVAKRQAENRKAATTAIAERKDVIQKIDDLIADGSPEAITEARKLAEQYKIDIGELL